MSINRRLLAAAAAAAIAATTAPALAQGVETGITAWQAGNYEEAIRVWRPLADRGDADAQFNLAQAYKLGRGVPINMTLAEQWYERAARQGHEQAGANLGLILFQNGQRQRAMPYIERAATGGDARAQYVLGTALFNGDLVGRDWPRAYALMSRAAASGLPPAVSQLRQMEQHLTPEDRARGADLASAMARNAPAVAATDPGVTGGVTGGVTRTPPPAGRPRVTGTQVPPSRVASPPSRVASPPSQRPVPPGLTIYPVEDGPAPRPQPPEGTQVRVAPAQSPPVAAAGGRWRIQLGAYSNDANARRAWGAVSSRLPGLRPVYSRAGNLVRLQAGPLASRAAADRACASVRSGGGACFPVAP